ncbi:DUF2505 domain-containing protein [Rhodococcus oryzae]|jgi:hypothetical protein|uniref:DUF2505 domain-containing protein n=1 Tax=Rhodococcus oryzae TaxID=2571143 RepID=A0ABY2RMF2_9NOCA|nr:DUF2505 domain-containing protein [Rhodococcus oryzae]TJZ79473.1 DUF2505 domain-containing protein [Rhodococcus oryzae]
MSRRIEFTANYTRPAAEIHRTLTDEGFWRNRVEQGADKGLTLARLTAGEGTIDVALAQDIDKAALPGVVSKILKGELSITRGEVWGPLTDGKAEGTFSTTATGIPINASGTATLVDTAEGSTLTVEGDVEVSVRLIGGTIEGLVTEQILGILAKDQEVVEEWITANS